MNDKKVKILCVGIGGYAHVYIRSIMDNPKPEYGIVGAVDPYATLSPFYERIQSENIPIYNDMEEFFAEHTADLVIISTPIHCHTKHILSALNHGCNVLCEKPLSGVSADEDLIEEAAQRAGKFVMIGYQWSYSTAIGKLKADVLSGLFGEPKFLKTLILWPRKKDYFTRGSGWAGKLTAKDGTVINDSVAANACAHYLHNMLYVCGDDGLAAEPYDVKADLLRVNDIENFDNSFISFSLKNGAKCLFIAGHSTDAIKQPAFEYRFEKATIKFSEDTPDIIAYFNDGTEKHYGSPDSDGHPKKGFIAIEGCMNPDFKPSCTHKTAAAHTRLIEAVQTNAIYSVKDEFIKEKDNGLYVPGLYDLMVRCYNDEILLRDSGEMEKLVK